MSVCTTCKPNNIAPGKMAPTQWIDAQKAMQFYFTVPNTRGSSDDGDSQRTLLDPSSISHDIGGDNENEKRG